MTCQQSLFHPLLAALHHQIYKENCCLYQQGFWAQEHQYFQSYPALNTTILAYRQNICERILQAKKEDRKTSQNLKALETKSPSFETATILKH